MKFKKLAIISDCVHVIDSEGKPATENHIFRKQIEMLASHFSEILICCPFTQNSPDKVVSAYSNGLLQFYPLKNVGGNKLTDKLNLLTAIPSWLKAFKKANDFADIVYQRFPNNLNIPGFFYFYFKKAKTFATYTGTWNDYDIEPVTYRFQKGLLKKYFRGPVGIYSSNIKNDGKFFQTFSPSYTLQDWNDETENVEAKIKRLQNEPEILPIFVTVGALVPHKNQQYILDTFKILNSRNFDFRLYVVGDGFLKNAYKKFIFDNNLQNKIFLAGKMTDVELRKIYRKADFLIQAPFAEGFGKVPIEGFFHGVVPLLSATAMAGDMAGSNNERGYLFNITHPDDMAHLILKITTEKNNLPSMIKNGRNYVRTQTLENWANIFVEKIKAYFE